MSIIPRSSSEISKEIASRAKSKRLSLNLSQKTLAERSGVSYGTLKKFEQTGQISLESLLKLAIVLEALNEFEELFKPGSMNIKSMDDLLNENPRKRGRT